MARFIAELLDYREEMHRKELNRAVFEAKREAKREAEKAKKKAEQKAKEEARSRALQMLEKQYPLEDIAEFCSLSLQEVKDLKDKCDN